MSLCIIVGTTSQLAHLKSGYHGVSKVAKNAKIVKTTRFRLKIEKNQKIHDF